MWGTNQSDQLHELLLFTALPVPCTLLWKVGRGGRGKNISRIQLKEIIKIIVNTPTSSPSSSKSRDFPALGASLWSLLNLLQQFYILLVLGAHATQILCLKKSFGELKEIQATKQKHFQFFPHFQAQLQFWFNYFTVPLNLHILPSENQDFVSSSLPFMLAMAACRKATSAHCQGLTFLTCQPAGTLMAEKFKLSEFK